MSGMDFNRKSEILASYGSADVYMFDGRKVAYSQNELNAPTKVGFLVLTLQLIHIEGVQG